jgi:hypothetical protein
MKRLRLKGLNNAVRFRVFYVKCAISSTNALVREFRTLKSMNQWIDRNETKFDFLLIARYAMIENKWEHFLTVGNKDITISELDKIITYEKRTVIDFGLETKNEE